MVHSGRADLLTMTRAGLKLPSDRPVALYMSSSAGAAKIVDLGQTNHADLDTSTLFKVVLRDVQPRSEIFIVTAAALPAINDQFLSVIGAAQTDKVKINIINIDRDHIPKRSRELYQSVGSKNRHR